MATKQELQSKIKEWYCKTYPTDELGAQIPDALTFADAMAALNNNWDFYDCLGTAADSLVRERIFEELSVIVDCSYDELYNKWLYGARS